MMNWPTFWKHFNFCPIFIKGSAVCWRALHVPVVIIILFQSWLLLHPRRATVSPLSPSTDLNIIYKYATFFTVILYISLSLSHAHTHTYTQTNTHTHPWYLPPSEHPSPSSPQWTEAGAGRGGQSLPPAVTAELLQPALLHPLLLALHLPAQPQARVPRLPLQRLQGLPGLQQAGQSLALLLLPEEQVRVGGGGGGGGGGIQGVCVCAKYTRLS